MQTNRNELFKIRPAGEWIHSAKTKPEPKMVFDRFWLEGELAVLFAATGKGKSVLGVQLAEAIARGREIEPFRMKLPAQKVLYFDLELSDKQFETRYAFDAEAGWTKVKKDHYEFSPDFLRAQAISYDDFPRGRSQSFCEHFYDMLHRAVRETGAKIVIIDDLAFLRRGRDRNREPARLLRNLRELKEVYGLSILVLARTPSRDATRGTISLADLEGSSVLANFADNIFAIGGSCADPSLRYLKHVKVRFTEADFDAANVPVFRIEKHRGNFLSFRFVSYGNESDLVRNGDKVFDQNLMKMVRGLAAEGQSQRTIADTLGISKTTVNRYIQIASRIEQEKKQKERPLTPRQEREQRLAEAVAYNHQLFLQRRAAEAAQRGMPPPPPPEQHPEPMTPSSVFSPDPDDEKCDCIECLAGRPKRCLDKASSSSRSP